MEVLDSDRAVTNGVGNCYAYGQFALGLVNNAVSLAGPSS
jgi:hypothetical protein